MEIKDSFQRLELLRERLNAPQKMLSFDKPMGRLESIEQKLQTTGLDVEKGDIQSVGPFLTYKGKFLAIVYILNSTSPSSDLQHNEPSKQTPKFHLTWCRTLEQMSKKKRFERYVLSRTPSNLFRVEALEHDPASIRRFGERHMLEEVRLFPCQNCLDALEYKGFTLSSSKKDRLQKVDEFEVRSFLDENDGNLAVMRHVPKTRAENARSGAYTSDFPEISRRLREEHYWRCTKCQVDMSHCKRGLHVHHVNGVKSDNSLGNLMVLCAVCHRGIDSHHSSMHVKPDIESYIFDHRP